MLKLDCVGEKKLPTPMASVFHSFKTRTLKMVKLCPPTTGDNRRANTNFRTPPSFGLRMSDED